MRKLCVILSLCVAACSSEAEPDSAPDAGDPNASVNATSNNDPTCDTPCPVGEYQEFGACDDDSCVTRMACGEEVTCRNQAACLGTATCTDGGLPLEACPADSQGCLPFMVCGVTKYCITLQQCAHDACDAAEVASALGCDDPSIDLPCREITACGSDTVACVCRAEDLFCEDMERLESTPCQGGEMCREVVGCGQTFYCKGGSI